MNRNERPDESGTQGLDGGGEPMDELKPCPFCGSRDVHLYGAEKWGIIVCDGCLTTFSQQETTCQEDVIYAWNRRFGNG